MLLVEGSPIIINFLQILQLSLKYDSELEDLLITLHEVKGQSNKEIHDSSDVFINTYLLPDTRYLTVGGVIGRGLSIKHTFRIT